MRSRSAKPILDEIDRVLAAHYGFTDEELDFIPSTKLRTGIPSAGLRAGNYDIKFRMGREEIVIIEESRQENAARAEITDEADLDQQD